MLPKYASYHQLRDMFTDNNSWSESCPECHTALMSFRSCARQDNRARNTSTNSPAPRVNELHAWVALMHIRFHPYLPWGTYFPPVVILPNDQLCFVRTHPFVSVHQ